MFLDSEINIGMAKRYFLDSLFFSKKTQPTKIKTMKKTLIAIVLFITTFGFSQNLADVKPQSIGPTIMSGRVVDLAVNEENPSAFYVAYATGGVWFTENNGLSFEPITDNAPTQNCGALAVDWKTGLILIGTGEVNSSRSSYAGEGLLASKDKGKTWQNIGLPDSHHISKVWINPANNNEIIVGVLGHLYSKNSERGVFKTTDFGKTWTKTLYINDETGIIDMAFAPNNTKIILAATWERQRSAWNFKGNGPNSGIYKSIDGGNSWTKLDNYPTHKGTGRIGLSAFNDKIFYAIVDNQDLRPNAKDAKMPENANAALFETEVVGATIHKTIDGGQSWTKTHKDYINDCFYSYGYYFADISVNPSDENRLYISGVPLLFSGDGGKSFEGIHKDNVHADHHVNWINPKNPNHIINGNDGGVHITFDNGKNWLKCNNQAVGQFYAVVADDEKVYNVYGGLQDNGVWTGPSNYTQSPAWYQEGKYPYEFLMGGDGMQVQVDKRNKNIVYTGYQFGNYYKIDRSSGSQTYITPQVPKGEKPAYRFNWETPILLSAFNQDILYMGGQYLFRSMNQGKDWEKISPDVTNGAVEGNVPFGTITSISESPFQFGKILLGTDDGNLQLTDNGGVNWKKISTSLPQGFWVSSAIQSHFKKERLYASLNGYRKDDFSPYLYVSQDNGTTWKSIASKLPNEPINVILEDTKNEDILYLGTDRGLYISFNQGLDWKKLETGLPSVAVHDLFIQNTAKDLIIATHGRSLYKISIKQLQQLNELKDKNIALFEIDNITASKNWGKKDWTWSPANEPKLDIWYYTKNDGIVTLKITDNGGEEITTQIMNAKSGLNKYVFDLKSHNKKPVSERQYLKAGKYKVTAKSGTTTATIGFEILEDKH